jgi:hypothetical protein
MRRRQLAQAVLTLIERHGDAKMSELLVEIANCPKARSPPSTIGATRR